MNVLQAFPISIAYLNTLQNIETFPETGHLFYLGLSEKSGNFGLSQRSMERIWKVKEFQNVNKNVIVLQSSEKYNNFYKLFKICKALNVQRNDTYPTAIPRICVCV